MSSPFRDALRKTTRLGSPPGSPSGSLPPTIDENKSFGQSDLHISTLMDNDEQMLQLSPSQAAVTTSTGMTVRSMRQWDVRMGPIKKQKVAGRMMPTMGGTVNFTGIVQKKRRITVEVQGPRKEEEKSEGNLLDMFGRGSLKKEEAEVTNSITSLGDTDTVVVRIFKRSRKRDSDPDGDDEDESIASDSVLSPLMSTTFGGQSPTMVDDDSVVYKEHRHYKLEEVSIIKTSGRALEVMMGTGGDTLIRDIKFETEHDAESFRKIVNLMMSRERERAQRQIARYRSSLSPTVLTIDGETKSRALSLTDTADAMINLLIEIVSATDLPVADISSTDPYVVVRMGGKEIHRTEIISKDLDPIWTLRQGGLFLLRMTPEEFFSASGGMAFIIKDFDALGKNELLGNVRVPLDDLLKGTGERVEYEIDTEKGFRKKGGAEPGRLYLRFKAASDDDITFLTEYAKNKDAVGVYSKECFLPLRAPASKLLKRQGKRGPSKEFLHRVRPFPDPAREEETMWMTKEQIVEESMKPSTHWVEVGSGNLGKLYIEILGCSKLPNMDIATTNIRDKTDAFACLVFEDAVCNTDVVGDTLSPRWMPWCRRAFAFNIAHPSSILLLGVFDYDPELSPLQMASRATGDLHDPIGRILVHVSNFAMDTEYTLAYPLFYGETEEQRKKERGKIWIRLRVECPDMKKAFLTAASPPPANVVSVARAIDFQVAHYTTEGPYDDKSFNLTTLANHVEELQSYETVLNTIREAAYTVWLWRGHYRATICGREFVLPLHSLTAFIWGLIVTWDFNTVPSFFLFSIGWAFVACNEMVNRNPSPWHKCKPYFSSWLVLAKGGSRQITIAPNERYEEFKAFEQEEDERLQRWARERQLEEEHEQELRHRLGTEFEEGGGTEEDIASSKGGVLKNLTVNPLKPVLYPIQLQLRDAVIGLRIVKSVVLWEETYFAFWITTACFAGSLLIIWVPFGFLFRWLFRVLAFVFLGPWMALVDRWYFREKPGMTAEEKDAEVRARLKSRYEEVLLAATDYQIRKERAVKLKNMKKYMFGKFHLRVPRFSEDTFKDTPGPESYAKPYNPRQSPPITIAERRYGQALTGDMIPMREIQAVKLTRTDSNLLKDMLKPAEMLADEALLKPAGKIADAARKPTEKLADAAMKPTEKIPLLGRFRKKGGKGDYDAISTEATG